MEPWVIAMISGCIGVLNGMILFILGQMKSDLKDNTTSTISLSSQMAAVDTKVGGLESRVNEINVRTHELVQAVIELKTINKLKGMGDD